MNAVIEHRIELVRRLGVDETSFLAANPHHTTVYATATTLSKRSAASSRGVG